MLVHVLLYALSFFLVWYGSGLIVSTASKFSKRLNLSPFVFSFLFLGLLTAIPEFSVGLQAMASNHSEIFVGNLLGGIIVLFLLVIPLLAIVGNGIDVKKEVHGKSLLLILGVILMPALFVLDGKLTRLEGLIMTGAYLLLMVFIQRQQRIIDLRIKLHARVKHSSPIDAVWLCMGVALVIISSKILLDETLFFANMLGLSAFYISLIIVSLGTEMPEFVLAVRSALTRKKDVAMGDYIGAAAASTLLFGIFTLLGDGDIMITGDFKPTFVFIVLALILFSVFSRSKLSISRNEGFLLLLAYVGFIVLQIAGK